MPAGGFRSLALLLLALLSGGLKAQTSVTWIGTSGNFFDPANWSPSGAPNSQTTAVFSSSTGGQVLVSTAGTVQGIQFMLADLYMGLQLGRTFVYQAAKRYDEGKLTRHEGYIAKIHCTELGFRAADRCMQIHGGMGLTLEMPIEKFWRLRRDRKSTRLNSSH